MRLILAAIAAGMVHAALSGAAAATIRIRIDNLSFVPPQVEAHVGDTVEWVNADFVPHTATARDKRWDIAIPAKGSSRLVLKRTGVVNYYCRFHPNMTGRISVSGK